MSGVLEELQRAIFNRLTTDPTVSSLITGVFDKPRLSQAAPYVTFGPVDWSEDDSEGLTVRDVSVQLDVWSVAQDGKREAFQVLDALRTSLNLYTADIGANALVEMRVMAGQVMHDPDGITLHGVLTVTALVQEF
jgi:hypothetical protein